MTQVGYQVVHSIAGRIRIRISWLESDPQATSSYQRLVEALPGVKAVRLNLLAHSIVVEYSPKSMSPAQAQELLIATLQQVKLTPPVDAPTVEDQQDPDQEKEPEPQPVTTAPPLDPPSNPSPMPSSKEPIVSELPSPWDDEPSLHIEPASHPTEENSKSIAQPMIESPQPVCSTASLAERLKVTSQAITRRRTKTDFGQWTKAQDPEGIAWNYHEHDRLFRPVLSKDPTSEGER